MSRKYGTQVSHPVDARSSANLKTCELLIQTIVQGFDHDMRLKNNFLGMDIHNSLVDDLSKVPDAAALRDGSFRGHRFRIAPVCNDIR